MVWSRRLLAALTALLFVAGVAALPGALRGTPPAGAAIAGASSAPAGPPAGCAVVSFTAAQVADLCATGLTRDGVGIVVVHGGGGVLGDRTTVTPWSERLRSAGYATMAVDYTLADRRASGPFFPRQELEVKDAIRWLRANGSAYGVERVVVLGLSHGASLGAFALVTPDDPAFGADPARSDRVDGFIGLYGYYDGFHLFPRAYYGRDAALRASARSIDRAPRATGPVLLIHGDRDRVVPVGQSRALDASLDAAGVPADLHLVAGGDHCFDHTPATLTADGEQVASLVIGWLDRAY